MALEVYGKSDPGCVRSANQDRILIDASLGLFLVCDGMGGHQHGEVAAEVAVASIRFFMDASRDRLDVSWPFGYTFEQSVDANRLGTAIRLANRQVWRRAEQSMETSGMGTTVAAVVLHEETAIVANIGDSRVYHYRLGQLRQLTLDDTMVEGLVQKGLLSEAEAAVHPMRNVLTQAAGSQETVEVHIQETPLEIGDMLLICSDGLYGPVKADAISAILESGETVEAISSKLVAAAIGAGAPDNVSAVVLRYS